MTSTHISAGLGGAARTGPYNLSRPDLAEARQTLAQLYGAAAPTICQRLLTKAGLTGQEVDPAALDRLIAVMLTDDPIISLCARSLAIRVSAFVHLSAAHERTHAI